MPILFQTSSSADRQEDAGRLTAEQVAHIKNFIEQVGGVENARAVIAAAEKLRAAA